LGQTGAETLESASPGSGGVEQGAPVNSQAPISGVVVLRVTPRISVGIIGKGVPRSFRAAEVGIRLPRSRFAYNGFTDTEFRSWDEAVCQLASVAWLVPLYPTKILAAGLKKILL
jgi:hypothetical protein